VATVYAGLQKEKLLERVCLRPAQSYLINLKGGEAND